MVSERGLAARYEMAQRNDEKLDSAGRGNCMDVKILRLHLAVSAEEGQKESSLGE